MLQGAAGPPKYAGGSSVMAVNHKALMHSIHRLTAGCDLLDEDI